MFLAFKTSFASLPKQPDRSPASGMSLLARGLFRGRGLALTSGILCVIALAAGTSPSLRTPLPDRASRAGLATEHMAEAGDLWFAVQSERREPHIKNLAAIQSLEWREQLSLEVKVQNRGALPRLVGPQDFRLQDPSGQSWTPSAAAFPVTPLEGRAYLHTVLAFDIPSSASNLHLIWSRAGQEARLPVGRAAAGGPTARPDPADCFPSVLDKCPDSFRRVGPLRRHP
jgi:hypothetical protein